MTAPGLIALAREWGCRLWATVSRRRADVDLAEELRVHEEFAAEATRRSADSLARTQRHAAIRIGGTAQALEALRDQRGFRWLDDLGRDVRHGSRLLTRQPSLALAAVATLALCIGANTVVFSVVDTLLLRPLPFDHPNALYAIRPTYKGAPRPFGSFADFQDWRAESRGFDAMSAVRGDGVSVTTPTGPEYLTGADVSDDFFAVFRVQPMLGRPFLASEHRPGHGQVVILSHGLWRRDFGGDPSVVGRTVAMDGQPQTIVGVMPAGFAFPPDAELWRPLTLVASDANRRADMLRVVGRLRRGVAEAQAQAELTTIAARLAQRHPGTNSQWAVTLTSLQALSTHRVRGTLLALWGSVGCLLAIGCANVGILLLANFIRRSRELSIRAALGAGRARLVRQLLSESLVLASLAGLASLLVARWGCLALRTFAGGDLASVRDLRLDGRVLLFAAALTIATGLVAGVLPVWRLLRRERSSDTRAGGVMTAEAGQHRLLRVLAMGQVSVSVLLLVAAGLMVRTVERLQSVPLGFNADHLLTFYVSLPEVRYPDEVRKRALFSALLERIRLLPGVRDASAVNALYINWANAIVVPVRVEGRPAPDPSQPADTHVRIVDPGLHRLLNIPVLRGRSFTPADGPDAPRRAVINETMARRYFAGEDPVGRHISVLGNAAHEPIWEEIVGVVGDVRQHGLDAEVSPEIDLPDTQSLSGIMSILVRTTPDPLTLVAPIRAQVRALDPNLPLLTVQSMDDVLASSMANRRMAFDLLSFFATVAVILTAIGITGVVTTGIGDRTREMAVRIALGARPSRVVWMVVRKMVLAVSVAIAAGLIASFAAVEVIQPLLFGINATDPLTYAAVTATLFSVAALCSWLPARRVIRLDPMVILRVD